MYGSLVCALVIYEKEIFICKSFLDYVLYSLMLQFDNLVSLDILEI